MGIRFTLSTLEFRFHLFRHQWIDAKWCQELFMSDQPLLPNPFLRATCHRARYVLEQELISERKEEQRRTLLRHHAQAVTTATKVEPAKKAAIIFLHSPGLE